MSNEDTTDNKVVYDTADKFINIANELSQDDNSGTVGSALRLAAARYSAFESTLLTKELAKDRDKMIEMFLKDFRQLLSHNIDLYAEHQKK